MPDGQRLALLIGAGIGGLTLRMVCQCSGTLRVIRAA
jgi:hypothetical protein